MHQTAFSRCSDHVALIRNPYIQGIARLALQGAICLHVVASTAALFVHSLAARAFALQCILTGIPSYAKNALFPPKVEHSPHPHRNLLFTWLERNLRAVPRELSKKIHQAIEKERLEEAELTALLDEIMVQEATIRPDAHDRDTLRKFLRSARAEFSERPRLSPLEEVLLRQKDENKLIEELQTLLCPIDEASLRERVGDQAEEAYLENRADFIRGQLPALASDRTWEQCRDNARGALGAIDRLQAWLEERRNKERKSRAQILLEREYCLLLRHRLSLSSDRQKFDARRADIAALNHSTEGILRDFHDQLVTRWTQAQRALPIQQKSLDDLRALNPANREAYFQALTPILRVLQKEETSCFLHSPPDSGYFAATGGNTIKGFGERAIIPILTAPARQELLSIKTSKQRRDARHSALANELLLACLEKTPDGQQWFHLTRKPRLSDTDRELRDASLQALKTVHERNQTILSRATHSTPEFVTELVRGERVPSLEHLQTHTWDPNLSTLMRDLNLDMSHWHADLQRIWAKHLPEEQKEELRALSGAARRKRMATLFSAWFTEKTGLPFTRPLSFSHIAIPTPRAAGPALRTLVPRVRRDARAEAAPTAPIFRGAPVDLVRLDAPAEVLPRFEVNAAAFEGADIERLDAANDPVSIVKRLPYYDRSSPLEERIAWLMRFSNERVFLNGLEQGPLFIFAAFQDVAAALTTPASPELILAFYNFAHSQGALRRDNSWREQVIHCYLQMLFAGQRTPIAVDDGQRKSLIQLAAHAKYRLPELTTARTAAESPLAEKCIARFGLTLQSIPEIGLEGLPESTVERSFQESTTPNAPETRTFIDALRARSGQELLPHLLPFVEAYHPVDHDQGQQALQRALTAALQGKEEGEIERRFDEILGRFPHADPAPDSLALPSRIFYFDCLRLLSPNNRRLAELGAFNQRLIESQDAPRMLLGYSREIVRLSHLYKRTPSIELFVELLRAKIAYQIIKKEHFSRRAPEGFLKLAVDQAEAAISSCSIEIQNLPFDRNGVVDRLNERDPDPARRTFAQKTIERIFRQQRTPPVLTPPFFLTFGSTDIDLITGIVYINGQQRVELPPELQNHPHLRFLNLQDLPYIPGRDGSFCHFTEGPDGRRVAQIRLSRSQITGELLIQRRLVANFNPPLRADWLQYVPLEQITAIPAAIAQRMGITEFWQDFAGTLYGYTAQGTLAFSTRDQQEITTTRGSYRFPEVRRLDPAQQAVLARLRSCLPSDEILIKDDGLSFWAPSLDLTISREGPQWRCTGTNISGVFLDTEQEPLPSALIFKPERPPASSRALEDKLILARKHLREAEEIARPSLAIKEERVRLRQEVAELEAKLAQQDSLIYLTVLPERHTAADDRILLRDQVQALIALTRQIAGTPDPAASRPLQERYLETERAYHATLRHYRELCTTRQTVSHETSGIGHVASRNLAGTAFLISQAAQRGPIQDPAAWIRELAKHPFTQPLDSYTYELIREARRASDLSDRRASLLGLYFSLLLCQDAFLRLQEETKTMTSDQTQRMDLARIQYERRQQECAELAAVHVQLREAPSALKSLLYVHCPESLPVAAAPIREPVAPMPAVAARELFALSLRTPLEGLGLMEEIHSEPKIADASISEGQKSLIKGFQTHSQDQVDGFYLEQFGVFTRGALNRLFALREGRALFGLTEEHITEIFEALKRGWIEQRPADTRFTVRKGRTTPLVIAQEEMLTLIAELPLSDGDRTQVARRLCSFLGQAARASFSFSWKDASSEARFQRVLAAESKTLHDQMLDAEFSLKERLREAGLSLTEFKKRVLSEDHRGFPPDETPDVQRQNFAAARTTLIRYLVLKTEWKHLDNAAKAPSVGERNQIELLSLGRQYPIDLLLAPMTPDHREDRIMQMAFLLFEEDYGARCTDSQIQLFRALMLDPRNPEAIDSFQARMGSGKTTLFPLLALIQIARESLLLPEQRSLVRYVVPSAVLPDNQAAFDGRLSAIFGSSVVRDRPFERYQINPADKEASFRWILEDLNRRLAFYRTVRDQSLVLIQSPEIRHCMEAQELAFGFLLTQNPPLSRAERALCMQCKQHLGTIRSMKTCTFFDELDYVQNFREEVNFTEGRKIPIDPSTICPLRTLIDCLAQHHALPPRDLATQMLGASHLPVDDRILDYVTDRSEPITTIRSLKEHLEGRDRARAPEQYASVFLIRALLLDRNIRSLAHERQPRTHFGVRYDLQDGVRIYSPDPESGSTLLIAVPYDGGKPKGLSTYQNPEVAAITTMRLYSSAETRLDQDPHLDFLVTQTQRNSIPAHLNNIVAAVRNPEGRSFMDQLQALSRLLDPAEIQPAKEKFHREFLENPSPAVRAYFGMAVVATQVRSDEGQANSDRYETGNPEDQIRGCSGTVEGTSSYFSRSEQDPAADGVLSLEIMGRAENAATVTLRPPRQDRDYLDEVLSSLLDHARPETRALIDVAGICKSRDGTPETVVAHLWTLIQRHPRIRGISGIIYYGNDNVKRIYRGPTRPPILCTTEMELAALHDRSYFSFYGQKNTRGSDIKQANGIHALGTLDINVLNPDAKQAILRLRNLIQRSSGQTFTFALTADFVTQLRTNMIAILEQEARAAAGAVAEARRAAETATARAEAATRGGDAAGAAQEERTAAEATAAAVAAGAKQRAVARKSAYIRAAAARERGNAGLAAIEEAAADAMRPRTERPEQTAARKRREQAITAGDIANDLRLREIAQEESDALLLFGKELKAHVKQAAAHLEHTLFLSQDMRNPVIQGMYQDFLTARTAIVPFLDRTLVDLEAKYGGSVQRENRAAYVAGRIRAADAQLDELNALFDRTARALRRAPPRNRLDFFVRRIEDSRRLFALRYRQDTVEVSTVDTAAQAVAMALAQAQARAQARAVAERIAQSVVHAQPRLAYPRLRMTAAPLFVPDPAWFANPTGRSVEQFDHIKHLIRPDLRGQIHLSPHLQTQPIVPHFALIPTDRTQPFLFVSQEEADQWLRIGNQALFTLYDLRRPTCFDDNPLLVNMKAAILQTQPALPTARITEDLRRATALPTLTPRQLLPTLQTDQDLSKFLDLRSFGIRANSHPLVVSFAKAGSAFTINMTGTQVRIPTNNEWLSPLFKEVYGDHSVVNKFTTLQRRHADNSEAFRRQLADLERQQAELRRRQEEMFARIRDASQFTISRELETGLTTRDREKGNDYGRQFNDKIAEIRQVQERIRGDASLQNLQALDRLFREFVSPEMLACANPATTPAFTQDQWQAFDKETLPPLDLVYGRILYDVHLPLCKDVQLVCGHAARCTVDDCQTIFNKTLPAMKKTVTAIRETIAALPEIEADIAALKARVDALNARRASLEEADRSLSEMQRLAPAIMRTLQRHGIDLDDGHSLWDRFHFDRLEEWAEETVAATIRGILPEYNRTVRESVSDYARRIHALTTTERAAQERHVRFLPTVLALAERVEERAAEVEVTA